MIPGDTVGERLAGGAYTYAPQLSGSPGIVARVRARKPEKKRRPTSVIDGLKGRSWKLEAGQFHIQCERCFQFIHHTGWAWHGAIPENPCKTIWQRRGA